MIERIKLAMAKALTPGVDYPSVDPEPFERAKSQFWQGYNDSQEAIRAVWNRVVRIL